MAPSPTTTTHYTDLRALYWSQSSDGSQWAISQAHLPPLPSSPFLFSFLILVPRIELTNLHVLGRCLCWWIIYIPGAFLYFFYIRNCTQDLVLARHAFCASELHPWPIYLIVIWEVSKLPTLGWNLGTFYLTLQIRAVMYTYFFFLFLHCLHFFSSLSN